MNIKISMVALLFTLISGGVTAGPFDIIPLPASVKPGEGKFVIGTDAEIRCNPELNELAGYASEIMKKEFGLSLKQLPATVGPLSNSINFQINQPNDGQLGMEGYVLRITPQSVLISANTSAGLFYGLQTVFQMLSGGDGHSLPVSVICDYPRFSYRGLHLDVSRHFMPVQLIYKLIDEMAMHKMNVFHWHLVDDQGWRLEIKKYPKLTEIGAWRVDREKQEWSHRPLAQPGEKATYGGFYTQEEVKAVVKYAQSRFITIIPEIEMPAHAMSALAAYPELSCTGKNLGVPPGGVWPITHIYCAGKEETFTFLENVLTEVMELFPSTYIHVGGDEADKTDWKQCPLCQKRIKEEGLKNEQELQSYFIQRIEKFLNKNGRKLVGWDEILEGGLAPEATVMSWRGEEGGIAAAKMGHSVIMTPTSYCYFDYYQGNPSLEPVAIGGFLPLKKVYSYEPVPKELNAEQGKYILGAQANVWTEYMPNPKHVEYMIFPRLDALAEVDWSPKESRNWEDFMRRMNTQYERYKKLDINFAQSAFQVNAVSTLNAEARNLTVDLTTEVSKPEIRYTLDGSEPVSISPLYSNPLTIDHSEILKAAVFADGKAVTTPMRKEFFIHDAIACPVSLKYPNSPKFRGSGVSTLVDGVKGTSSSGDGKWLGFNKEDMVATVDLGRPSKIKSVEVDGLQDAAAWIFLPKEVIIEVSADGINFRPLGKVSHKIPVNSPNKVTHNFLLKKQASQVRFVRVTSRNIGVCPKGHPGEGQAAWVFASEIIIK